MKEQIANSPSLANNPTVAIITALPMEQAAMKAMLESPVSHTTPASVPGEYLLGQVPAKGGGCHVVLLACSSMGENLAAAHTSALLERFPGIREVLVVGIAGGAPDPSKSETDIRLGDVVVSNGDGVIQYDHDKEITRSGVVDLVPRYPPRPPSSRLLAAAEELRRLELEGTRSWEKFVGLGEEFSWAVRPTTEHDKLYDSQETERAIPRPAREPANTSKIFHGRIGSGNKLLKNAKLRERLRKAFVIKAVEMEASGVADAVWLQQRWFFVVRGISDYCDEHKNDAWQGYAALIAAAYARALLEQTTAISIQQEPTQVHPPNSHPNLSRLPPRLTQRCAYLSDSDGRSMLPAALEELFVADAQVDSPFDGGWPLKETWTTLVLRNLDETLATDSISVTKDEAFLGLALVPFMSFVRKAWIRAQFDSEGPVQDRWFGELFAANPTLEIVKPEPPNPAFEVLKRAAVLRVTSNRRQHWPDSVFREHCSDAQLALALASNPLVAATLRAIGGNIDDFKALPENAYVRFGECSFQIRCQRLASILSLAELSVLGLHLLSDEVLDNVARLPDVAQAVERQFQEEVHLSLDQGNRWTLRATCDEPVLDFALQQIAGCLTTELRERRAAMSDYMMRTTQSGFPAVVTEIHPRLHNGRPRYTTPHVMFTLSLEHARRIFMGSDLWGDDSLAFRELYQNALDACRYRRARCRHLAIPYEPLIQIFHGRDANGEEFVECTDNGIGMTRDIVSSCFSTGGRRFVETPEFRDEREKWRQGGFEVHPNSQFGIGVFSYFLVADELEVETARLGQNGEVPAERLLLRVPTASSFFRIISLTRAEALEGSRTRTGVQSGYGLRHELDAGTRVRLRLRRRVARDDRIEEAPSTCLDAIRRHVWYTEFRTVVRDYRGGDLTIEPNTLAPWIEDATRVKAGELDFWWLCREGMPVTHTYGQSAETFRSRKDNARNGGFGYRSLGRVLVDGIATDMTTPGFIINLTGSLAPRLSLDRSKIRSDVREVLEDAVDAALPSLPDPVPESLLEDLWRWDPRACHRARAGKSRKWTQSRYELSGRNASNVSQIERTYLPRLPDPKPFPWQQSPTRTTLIEMWKLANDMPDARERTPFVLESRGISRSLASKVVRVPTVIWKALQAVELGVAEAAAIHYGMDEATSKVLTAYMSWLTGESMATSFAKLRKLSEFVDLPCAPYERVPETVVADWDAWLLGGGRLQTPWVGPEIHTVDVLHFCVRTGRDTFGAVEEYRQVATRLNFEFAFDAELAQRAQPLTDHDFTEVHMLRRGYGPVMALEPERVEVLARLAGVSVPKRSVDLPNPEAPELDEEERAIIRVLCQGTRRSEQMAFGLADACSVARALDRPFAEALERVNKAAQKLHVDRDWATVEQGQVEALSEDDWTMIEDTSGFSSRKELYPRKPRALAGWLGTHSYLYKPQEVHERLTLLYQLFRWGPLPLSSDQTERALALRYRQGRLLESAPESGKYSIARALVAAMDLDMDIDTVDSALRELSPFGVSGPDPDEIYLGITWREVIAPSTKDQTHGALHGRDDGRC